MRWFSSNSSWNRTFLKNIESWRDHPCLVMRSDNKIYWIVILEKKLESLFWRKKKRRTQKKNYMLKHYSKDYITVVTKNVKEYIVSTQKNRIIILKLHCWGEYTTYRNSTHRYDSMQGIITHIKKLSHHHIIIIHRR